MTGFLVLLPALALSQSSALPPLDADWVTVGTYRINGQDVPAKVPPASVQPRVRATVREFEGFKYAFDREGHLVERYQHGGSWDEVIKGLPLARAAMPTDLPEWRVKVFILTRADVLRREGNLREIERLTLERPQIQMIQESLARFGAIAETLGQGAIRVSFDVTLDQEWQLAEQAPPRIRVNGPLRPPFDGPLGPDWLRRYLGPRINGGDYEAEDRVNRGPWDTVLVVHPGLTEASRDGIWVTGNPSFSVPFYAAVQLHGRLGLTQALLDAWYGSALALAERQGFRTPVAEGRETIPLDGPGLGSIQANRAILWPRGWSLSQSVAPQGDLARLRNRLNPPAGAFSSRRSSRYLLDRDGALTLVPPGVGLQVGGQGTDFGLSNPNVPMPLFTAERMDASYLPFLSANLREPLQVVQVSDTPGGRSVLLRHPDGRDVKIPLGRILKSAVEEGSPPAALSAGPLPWGPEFVDVSGEWNASWVPGPDGGRVLRLSGTGPVRTGLVSLLRATPGQANLPDGLILTLRARATRPEPLRVGMSSASLSGDILLVPGDGEWHSLSLALPRNGILDPAALLVIGPSSPGLPRVPLGLGQPMEIELAAPALTVGAVPAAASLEVIGTAAASEIPLERARFAAETPANPGLERLAQVTALLKDRSDLVKLNAAEVFTREKHPPAVPDLIVASNSIEHWLADRALRALAFQDTPEAWAAIKRAVEIGPNDFTRAFAAPLLATRKERATLGSLVVLYATRSWQTRLAGAQAVGLLGTRESALAQMTFLNELDPAVRLAVALTADVSVETVVRRMQWHRVNDASDAVRLAAAIRLSGSAVPEVVAEADQAVADDSRWVRVAYLEHLARAPRESARAALRQAVTDLLPEVRAAALLAFAKLPGAVRLEEVQNVLRDEDPRVQQALRTLAESKQLTIPRPSVEK